MYCFVDNAIPGYSRISHLSTIFGSALSCIYLTIYVFAYIYAIDCLDFSRK